MPGRNPKQRTLELDAQQQQSRENLRRIVNKLAGEIGERNATNYAGLQAAEQFITDEFKQRGYTVRTEIFDYDGVEMRNIEAEQIGASESDEIIVIGAHYDTVYGSPGADDNASGVAAMIEIADKMAGARHRRTIRFVAFANEENAGGVSWETMGSANYARSCHKRNEKIVGMFSLEMLGVYSDQVGSQKYPNPFNLFYPDVGNFIAFVGKLETGEFVRNCIRKFRADSLVPSEGVAAPEVFSDIHRSDHWGFWQFGYHNALMVTDTSNYRNPNYHMRTDTPETIDFHRLTLVGAGLTAVVRHLLND
jgi:hypothetical protein